MFSLRYLSCRSAWPHRWTDCCTQGDAFRNFQLPVSESEHWHRRVRFRPNGLHFLSLTLQWCWNQPLSRKVVWGMLVTRYWTGNKDKFNVKASRFIYVSSVNCKWGKNVHFLLQRSQMLRSKKHICFPTRLQLVFKAKQIVSWIFWWDDSLYLRLSCISHEMFFFLTLMCFF